MKDRRIRAIEKLAARVIDGEAVILTLADSKLHRLNETASHVWHLVEAGTTVEAAVASVCDAYDVAPDEARRDVEAILGLFVEKGFAAWVSDESA